MPVMDWHSIYPKFLVCAKCRKRVEKKFFGFYSCDHCDSWVRKVVWEEHRPAS